MRNSRVRLAGAAIIGGACVAAYLAGVDDAPTFDEVAHIGAGFSYVARADGRLNPEHPPLVKDLSGFAMAPLRLGDRAFASAAWTDEVNGEWDFGRQLMFQSDVSASTILRAARGPTLLFLAGAGVLVYLWAARLYGPRAGLIALALVLGSPTVLAHGHLVTTDVPALFAITLAIFLIRRDLERRTPLSLAWAAAGFGVAQVTKFSALMLVPWLALFAAARHAAGCDGRRTWGRAAAIVLAGFLLVVLPLYSMHTLGYPAERQLRDAREIARRYEAGSTVGGVLDRVAMHAVTRPLALYVAGATIVRFSSTHAYEPFLLGNFGPSAAYFPVSYILKEPLAFLILLVAAVATVRIRQSAVSWIRVHPDETAMLLWLGLYWCAALAAGLQLGVRHLLPTYGCMAILMAGRFEPLLARTAPRALRAAIVLLLIGHASAAVRAFPHYLAFFNELVPRERKHAYLVDSNLDWGQDLARLGYWVSARRLSHVDVDYFGMAPPSYYLSDTYHASPDGGYTSREALLARHPNGAYLAVSATNYSWRRTGGQRVYGWLDAYRPLANIGGSILIWRVSP